MTEEAALQLPAFDPATVSESNFTSYPEPHRAVNSMRHNRRLGDSLQVKCRDHCLHCKRFCYHSGSLQRHTRGAEGPRTLA